MLNRKLIYIFIVSILATLQIFAQSQDPPDAEDLKRKVIQREVNDIAEGKWEYKVKYPELRLAGDVIHKGFSQTAKNLAQKHINSFRKNMSEMTEDDWKNRPTGLNYEMTLGYQVELLNDDFVSVSFGRYEYTGGAHGNGWTITLNYDLKNDKVLELNDLFKENTNYLNIISKSSIEQITKKQGEYAAVDWINQGASPKPENFRSWNITEQGLKFHFDPYQVGPYAAGSFETIVPYDQFLSRMKASLFYKAETASYIDGNPPNWCRNGLFTTQKVDFKLAYVKNDKTYFSGDDKSTCPDGVNCKQSSYVVKGDEVIIGRIYNNFACAWYQPEKGSETVGWLPLNNLTVQGRKSPVYDWTGDWSFYENDIKFVKTKNAGEYVVEGTALWKGLGDNVHIGDLGEETVKPKNGMLSFGGVDKYDCSVQMQRIGKYLLVSDNKNCGGVNVTFDGIYVKKAKSDSVSINVECVRGDFLEMTYGGERNLDFRLGSVKTAKNQRAYFMDKSGKSLKSYLVQGDQIIVSKTIDNLACAWYQPKKGKETIGWMSLDNLSFKPSGSVRQSWVGTWEYGEGEIKVIPQKRAGAYKFKGQTFWIGQGEGNVNIGEIDFVTSPVANSLSANGTKDLPECKLKMKLLGDFMVVSDNDRCGGRNVTFDGIYRKK